MAMRRSTERILVSHAGTAPRPAGLTDLPAAVKEVVNKQVEAGIHIVNDGEFGKPTSDEVDYVAWANYVWERVEGYDTVQLSLSGTMRGADQERFADFYHSGAADMTENDSVTVGMCVGPLSYSGQTVMERDTANLASARESVSTVGGFMTALSPHPWVAPGQYYDNPDDEMRALAEAMHEEYQAIVDAGFEIQIDDPYLVNTFEFDYSVDWNMTDFRKWAEPHIELVNHALEGIPAERVRYHVCWGSWRGPHSSDLPMKDVVDLILKVNAGQYSFEAANAQHEHEWEVWSNVKLPEGKTLLPGVVSHKTNILEHPDLVAQRLVRFAKLVGRENVIASTDCGMGGRIHPGLAWAKLGALSEGAALASKQLW